MSIVSLSPVGNDEQYFTAQGVVAGSGFQLFTYTAGTLNPVATYTDITGLTPNANPIILNSTGRAPQEIWIPAGVSVKFVLKDQNNVVQWTRDNIPGINDVLAFSGVSAAMLPVVQAATVDAGRAAMGIAGDNLIVGDMQVWQRGLVFNNASVSSGFYTCDRWGANRNSDVAGMTIFRTGLGVQSLPRFGIGQQRAPGNASAAPMNLFYTAETMDSQGLAGQTITFSVYCGAAANYSGGNVTLTLFSGTGVDERVYAFTGSATLGSSSTSINIGSYKRLSVTVTVPTNASEVGLSTSWTPSGTAGANDYVVFAAPKLEIGSVATPFIARPFAQELSMCQRYYEKSFPYVTAPAQNAGSTGALCFTQAVAASTVSQGNQISFKVTKRTGVGCIIYNPAAANGQARNLGTGADCSTLVATTGPSDSGQSVQFVTAPGSAAGDVNAFHWTNDAEL